eukprot:893965-Pelagomonas_calceolata.AAC.1
MPISPPSVAAGSSPLQPFYQKDSYTSKQTNETYRFISKLMMRGGPFCMKSTPLKKRSGSQDKLITGLKAQLHLKLLDIRKPETKCKNIVPLWWTEVFAHGFFNHEETPSLCRCRGYRPTEPPTFYKSASPSSTLKMLIFLAISTALLPSTLPEDSTFSRRAFSVDRYSGPCRRKGGKGGIEEEGKKGVDELMASLFLSGAMHQLFKSTLKQSEQSTRMQSKHTNGDGFARTFAGSLSGVAHQHQGHAEVTQAQQMNDNIPMLKSYSHRRLTLAEALFRMLT